MTAGRGAGPARGSPGRPGVFGFVSGLGRCGPLGYRLRPLLEPGGFVVVVARPFRRAGQLVGIPTMAATAARQAGFSVHERCVAPLAAARDDGLTGRASFFQHANARDAIAAGNPTHARVHEEVIAATPPAEREGPYAVNDEGVECSAAGCDMCGSRA